MDYLGAEGGAKQEDGAGQAGEFEQHRAGCAVVVGKSEASAAGKSNGVVVEIENNGAATGEMSSAGVNPEPAANQTGVIICWPASSSYAGTRTDNLINSTDLLPSGVKQSENEARLELRVASRIDSELIQKQLWHYSPPPSDDHNFHTRAPIDAPFSSFQERASSSNGHESSPIRINEGRGRKGDNKLEDALGAMGMEVVLGCSNGAVEPRICVLSLKSKYGLGLVKAKFGAEVAKESTRNEKNAKKSFKAKSRAYAYAPKEPVRTRCHALGITS
ncbi:hypothetical protein PIB30_056170 [Stylosanthes scabra]|uniref:Uncharacterized protein n=1 Tax=Stylosanthes scabra TaxID=79078 RepID=A0ABU6RJL9_9FABA|nr:hypothetical protein [Stylosanthes scabra]